MTLYSIAQVCTTLYSIVKWILWRTSGPHVNTMSHTRAWHYFFLFFRFFPLTGTKHEGAEKWECWNEVVISFWGNFVTTNAGVMGYCSGCHLRSIFFQFSIFSVSMDELGVTSWHTFDWVSTSRKLHVGWHSKSKKKKDGWQTSIFLEMSWCLVSNWLIHQ